MKGLHSIRTLFVNASKRWSSKGAPTQAAALAFYALTSLAPLLVICIMVAGALYGDEAVRGLLVERLEGRIGREAAVVLERQVQGIALGGGGLVPGLFAVLTVGLASTGLFLQLRGALNALREAAPKGEGVVWKMIRQRLLAFLLVLGTGVVLVLSLFAQTALSSAAAWLAAWSGLAVGALVVADVFVTLAAVTGLLAVVFRYLPEVRMPWRSAALGSALTALLFVPGGWLIGAYLARAGTGSAYGAAGSLVVLLFWIYYASMLLLWGAAVAVEHAVRGEAAPGTGAPAKTRSGRRGGPAPGADRTDAGRHAASRGTLVLLACAIIPAAAPARAFAQEGRVRVEVTGVNGDARRNVLAILSLARVDGQPESEMRVRSLHGRAEGEIRSALEPFGYYRASVVSSLRFENGRWLASYRIDPDSAIRLRRVHVEVLGEGEGDEAFREAARAFPLQPGDPVLHAGYETGKAALVGVATRRGYLDAAFDTAEIRIDRDAYRADIVLVYRTGPRFVFGPVTFVQDVLDEGVLRTLVPFREGEPFDANRLLELQIALSQGPWFSGVEVVPRREDARELEVPIVVELRPRKPERYLIGGGYGTDTGPRGTLEFELRRVGRQGHRAEGRIRASAIERDASAQYFIPLRFPRTEVLAFTAGYAKLTPRTSESEKLLLGAAVARARGRWRENFSLNYQRESYRTGVDRGLSNQLIGGVAWSRTKADDRVFPLDGYSARFQLQGSHEAVLSDVSLIRADAHVARIFSPAVQFRVLLRIDAGIAHSPVFRDVPATLRFYAGGDQSLRGYGYQALGPRDENGSVVGGDRLLTGSIEIERRLLDRWGIAFFVDGGNAFSTGAEPVEAGAGAGIRWLSPIGLIRLDGAWAVTRSGTPFRLHVRIGPDL